MTERARCGVQQRVGRDSLRAITCRYHRPLSADLIGIGEADGDGWPVTPSCWRSDVP
jgi:hypothetical protein